MENLKFLNTQSVAQFKADVQTDEIKVLRNEQTGKCFFSYGCGTGAVTSKYPESPLNNPVVSEVASTETGETFYLLHNEGEGGATKLETL